MTVVVEFDLQVSLLLSMLSSGLVVQNFSRNTRNGVVERGLDSSGSVYGPLGRATARAVSRQPPDRTLFSPFAICCERRGTALGVCPSPSVSAVSFIPPLRHFQLRIVWAGHGARLHRDSLTPSQV
jgi:hypothetical protein